MNVITAVLAAVFADMIWDYIARSLLHYDPPDRRQYTLMKSLFVAFIAATFGTLGSPETWLLFFVIFFGLELASEAIAGRF
jgi:hypothetical protein